MNSEQLWSRYQKHLCALPGLGIKLDISRMKFDDDFFKGMAGKMEAAYDAMDALEGGAIANPDEGRMVGHYWLRDSDLAPNAELKATIDKSVADVEAFAGKVHRKEIAPPSGGRYSELVLVGIGGSALGPQLVDDCLGGLGGKRDKMNVHYVDNTDPDGVDRVVRRLASKIKATLVVVISKSGGTKETRNGMLEMAKAFEDAGLDFGKQAVAVTGVDSALDQYAKENGWVARFEMWDWVGGRTSVMSAVGLLPAALQGVKIDSFLKGAGAMDAATRKRDTKKNPAALLALMWYHATGGVGNKDMVILPYKDRLLYFSRYLQQLIMESLGKEHDLDGEVVNQGISVYGNKGSTDQHAYIQQLRDGVKNFFATFIVVLQDRGDKRVEGNFMVEDGATSGDYLSGFWQGTRQALYESGRESLTITVSKLDAKTLGALIGLYERAVGFYASLVNVNAYHQPGVEAGKKAAVTVLDVQMKVLGVIDRLDEPTRVDEVAALAGCDDQAEAVGHILEHLAANKRGVKVVKGKYQKTADAQALAGV